MQIATWNLNGIRARATRLFEWLDERKPDIVCVQELKATEEEFPHLELRAAGYRAAIVGQRGWNGVAVLAREEPEPVLRELPGAPADSGSRFLLVRTAGLEIASAYIPNGKDVRLPDFATKLAWLERLALFAEGRADRDAPLVVAGDFNVCRTDLDSYLGEPARGTIFHTEAERERLGRVEKAGLADLFRALHPVDPGYSYWDYRAGAFHKQKGMRLDMLFATEAVARRVKDVFVDREFRKKGKESGALPSDHAPVVAVLD
jgi:exodeoxyribonuclease-3